MAWMNDLTIAVIEEDSFRIGALMSCVPEFTDLNEAKSALALIGKAIEIVDRQKEEALMQMQKIKQTKAFLLSDEAKHHRFIG